MSIGTFTYELKRCTDAPIKILYCFDKALHHYNLQYVEWIFIQVLDGSKCNLYVNMKGMSMHKLKIS